MWIIIAAFFLAMTFFLKKVMQFHRDEINVPELLRGLRNTLQRNAIVEALSLCDNTPGPIAKLLGAAILAYQNGGELRTAMDDVAVVEIPRLERHIHFIGTISFVMPLLGFLGTVIGMIEAFEATKISSGMFPELADAIGTALMTTAAGLTGFFGYFFGTAILANIVIGYVAESAGWDWTFILLIAACLLSIVFMAFTYKEEQYLVQSHK